MRAAAVMLVALLAPPALAAKVSNVEVTKEDGRYYVSSDIAVDAARERVFRVLADYDNFERVTSVFEESHFLSQDESGGGVIYTRVHDCLLFFCRTIERVENMTVEPPRLIVTTVIPERSDVNSGESRWLLSEDGNVTLIRHEMMLEPNFWVPPVIGTYLIKRYLAKGGQRAAERLERIANEDHSVDPGLDVH